MIHALKRNIGAFLRPAIGILPQDASAGTINGAAIDRMSPGGTDESFESCVLHAVAGAETGTPTSKTVDAKLQESADGSSGWADITDAAVTTITADDTQETVDVDLSGALRYIRVVEVVAFVGGTTPTVPVASSVILGGDKKLAVADS